MLKKIVLALAAIPFVMGIAYAKERKGEVVFQVIVEAPENSNDVRVWIPYPVTDNEQTIEDIHINGNYSYSGIYGQKDGDLALYAEWTKPEKERTVTLTFKASAMERVKKDFPAKEDANIPAEIQEFTKGSRYVPTDGKIREIALKITKGKKTIRQKAKAVYDWTIENTFRNPDIQGCGTGNVERILSEKSGKCADISGVYVALARAAGVPAREVWGLRLGKKQVDDITGGHHCWAEFYLPGYGWVPVDPADVRKAMLVEKLELNDTKTKEYRNYYFGAV
ncbi:MAG: transglutaminase domain-containing protein, partial [Candidatus Omnitrophica bacterium]|nr:transglutaminase domain-containing protein [Candidatus Omnitrophota bacterium]